MKTLSRLVLIFAFVGIAHAALIVPFWQQLEEPEEPKPKNPELKKLEELDQPAELEKSEELFANPDPIPIPTDLARKIHEFEKFKKSPYWKSLFDNEKALVMSHVMAAILWSPQFSPFGG